jgi:hypothetical protein
MEIYQDRFLGKSYSGDEPVCFGIRQNGSDTQWLAEMPENLFVRCQLIARAYSLHLLPSINYNESISLDRTQCQGLIEELEFIQFVVNDPLLETYLRPLKEIVLQCARSPFINTTFLLIEGPCNPPVK